MRTLAFRLFLLFVPLLFILLSCKKDEDKNKFRIISEESFKNGDSYGEAKFEYKDNNISRYTYEEADDDFFGEAIFDYSEANKIYITVTDNDAGDEEEYKLEITLSDGNFTEIVDDDGYKEVYTYNESDQLVKAKEYEDYGDGWFLYVTTTFTYDGVRLDESLRKYEDDGSQYKNEYFYDGDGYLEEMINYYYSNSEWFESYKEVYSYTAGRVTEIESYYFNNGDWENEGWREEFAYDENGNLVESTSIDENYDEEWTTKYAYEAGSGNYRQFFGSYYFMGTDFVSYPKPTKSTRRDMDITETKDRINVYRSPDNKRTPTEIFRPQRNRPSGSRNF